MADSGIKVRVEGEIAYIALNRPEKRNAINQAMLRALPEAIDEVDRNDVRAVIIYGEGQAFSAGVDFTSLANETGARGGERGGAHTQTLLARLGGAGRAARGRTREADHRQGPWPRQDDVPGARSAGAELSAAHRGFSRRRVRAGAAPRSEIQGTLRRISNPVSKVWPGASSRIPAATPRAARLKASAAQVYGSRV